MDAYALVAVPLRGDHHIRLVQDEHGDLLGVDEMVLGAPVEDGARRSDHNLLLQWDASFHCRGNSCTDIRATGLSLPSTSLLWPVIPLMCRDSYVCCPECHKPA